MEQLGLPACTVWPLLTSTEATDNLRHCSTEGQKVMPFELSIFNWTWFSKNEVFSHKVIPIFISYQEGQHIVSLTNSKKSYEIH